MKYYKNLYRDPDITDEKINEYFQQVKPQKQLKKREADSCGNPVTTTELRKVVKSLKKNKSPGLNGLTSEFYQIFWTKLEPIYLNMLEESLLKGMLPVSTKRAVISLIFKKGDKTLLKNYRPISLTNYDYKILTFILAKHIQSVISKLIFQEQCGYIKGLYIGQNARLIKDIIEYYDNNNLPGAIICLDFEKAFDSLNWNFMLKALSHYGFNQSFIKWIQLIYNEPTFCVKNNGLVSKEDVMMRRIRQGCAISALLFILPVKFMAVHIR